MKRFIGASLAVLLSATSALAGTSTITVLDSVGATKTYAVTTNAGAAFIQQMVTCDGTAAAQCTAVKAASTAAVATDPALVVAISPNNTVAATQSGTWNVTNVSGTVSLPTGASTAALQPTTNAVAGTTTAGTTGTLAFGAVTTGSPTYTTANTNPLSLDTAGNLRTNCVAGCAAGSTSNASSAVATSSTNGATVAYNYGFNGATWDQLQVDASKNLKVNVTNANANGRAVNSGAAPAILTPALTTSHLIAAASTNATSVKASAATLYSCQMSNNSTTAGYLKIYNKASAPTVGTDVPVKTLIIPGPAAGGGGSNVIFGSGGGLTLATGFAIAVTNGIADTDNVAVAAATFAINCDYE